MLKCCANKELRYISVCGKKKDSCSMHEEVIYARGDDLSLYKATIKSQLLFLCVDWGSG